MRIKMTKPQLIALGQHTTEHDDALTYGASYVDIPDGIGPDVLRSFARGYNEYGAEQTAPGDAVRAKLTAAFGTPVAEHTPTTLDGWNEPTGPLGGDPLPQRQAAVVRAIEEGNYGGAARGVVRDNPIRDGERPTRWLARVRHTLYVTNNNRAGDALQTIGGQA